MELTNTKQWKDEPVVDFINRWRSLSLDCKDRLSEVSAMEMCIQGMHWGLLYILQGNVFDWYIDLEPECIDSWDQMEREFLNCFYNTRLIVSMMELLTLINGKMS